MAHGGAAERALPDSHEFVALRDGRCHYRADGPVGAPVVLLIHGATVPGWQFDRIVPHLNAAGYRTLRADLYGHGYSDRPRARYDHELFLRQHLELLDALGIGAAVRVLGHSLGAAIASRLAARYPERVSQLVLTAPLVNFTGNVAASRLLAVPLVGEALTAAYVVPMLVRRRTRRYRGIEGGRFVRAFRDQLIKPGFPRALLSMIRSGALGDQRGCYAALADTDHPILLVRGADDTVLPRRQLEVARDLVQRARYVEIAEATHSLLLTDPEPVAASVLEFFSAAR